MSVMMQRQASTIQTTQTQRQVPVIQKAQRTAEVPQVQRSVRGRGYPCFPQMVEEKIAEVVKVIPREPPSERADRTRPVEISQEQVQQRTVELEHSLEHETDEVSEV